MKRYWAPPAIGLVLAASIICYVRALEDQEGVKRDYEHTIEHDGRTRYYGIHLPPGYDGRQALPVVVNLHGGGASESAARRQSLMDGVADRHGFIVVYPEGTGRLKHRFLTWNAGTCCAYAVDNKIDDVGFIRKLLDELPRHYAIDTTRIYATGMSNGAMLCYRLACELPGRFAAIAPVSGSLGVDGPAPTQPIPIIHFHGRLDPNVPFAGGVGPNARVRVSHRSVEDSTTFFRAVNRCDKHPPEIEEHPDVIIHRYLPAADAALPGAPIVIYELREGGHTWPGGVDLTPTLGTGKLIDSVDASTIMWEFFRQFTTQPPAAAAK